MHIIHIQARAARVARARPLPVASPLPCPLSQRPQVLWEKLRRGREVTARRLTARSLSVVSPRLREAQHDCSEARVVVRPRGRLYGGRRIDVHERLRAPSSQLSRRRITLSPFVSAVGSWLCGLVTLASLRLGHSGSCGSIITRTRDYDRAQAPTALAVMMYSFVCLRFDYQASMSSMISRLYPRARPLVGAAGEHSSYGIDAVSTGSVGGDKASWFKMCRRALVR